MVELGDVITLKAFKSADDAFCQGFVGGHRITQGAASSVMVSRPKETILMDRRIGMQARPKKRKAKP